MLLPGLGWLHFLARVSYGVARRAGVVEKKKARLAARVLLCGGDSDRIQTCNLLIRSQMLYSVKLRSQHLFLYL